MKLNILLVEEFLHPVEKVWRALTDPAALRVWLMDNDFEPLVGKHFILRERNVRAGWRGWIECEVLELEMPNRMLWSWIHNEGDSPTQVEFRLERIQGGTRLTLSHTGEVASDLEARLRGGWPGKLAGLRGIVADTIETAR
jgi:uncharacterized protein YndB with AHSA1/START domain